MRFVFLILFTWIAVFCVSAQKQITLQDLFQKEIFYQEQVKGLSPMNDGEHYSVMENRSQIVRYSYQTGQRVSVVFDLKNVENSPISSFSDYEFSDDETKILLTTEKEPIHRHSFSANYYVWNSVTQELLPLSEKGKQRVATFSPDGERVAFVRDNNLFVKSLRFGTENQVTYDGIQNKLLNGIPDWVYEEEFGFTKALAWSPDSRFLAFIKFDESEVKNYGITMFRGLNPSLDENSLYPGGFTYKYPKAGEKNSKVEVHVHEIRSRTTIPADIGQETDIYVPRIKWTPDGNDLVIMRLNRRQNQLDILYANPFTGDSRQIFSEKNEKYVSDDILDQFIYLDNGHFVITSERDGYSHLYLHDKQGFELTQLTKGNFDVTNFYGYDPVRKLYYYQAAAESPLRREVYFTTQDGKRQGKLSTLSGTNSATFSKGFKYYVNKFNNNSTPELTTIHDWQGKQLKVFNSNERVKSTLKEYNIQPKEFFKFTTSEGVELNGWMLKPPNFDTSKKYPVVIVQYSGPNSQQVTDRYGVNYNYYLAQEGFLVVCVDPRGTAARGEAFRKVTYMQLGKYESDDMVETARYLALQPYVDGQNIGIWGWSYGGYMVALTMAKGGELFKAGIAVAPVTNWRFYDTAYTERYMRVPDENPDGYDENSPITHAHKVKGRMLIVHGTADDNVHVQNTMEYIEALVQAGVQFDLALYTNRNHSIRGGNTTMHLYTLKTNFLKRELMGK